VEDQEAEETFWCRERIVTSILQAIFLASGSPFSAVFRLSHTPAGSILSAPDCSPLPHESMAGRECTSRQVYAFLDRLLSSAHRVSSPESADYFFVPAVGPRMLRRHDVMRYVRDTWYVTLALSLCLCLCLCLSVSLSTAVRASRGHALAHRPTASHDYRAEVTRGRNGLLVIDRPFDALKTPVL
jgi:hypothetical protein